MALLLLLLMLSNGIFSRCDGQLTTSSSLTFSIGNNSFSSSFPWSSSNSSSTLTSNMSSAILPNGTSIAVAKSSSYTPLTVSTDTSILPSIVSISTQPKNVPQTITHLTSFGIFLVTFGGVLVAFMIIALMWICCSGREKSPQAPHIQVKLKPWSRTKDQTSNEVTTEETDLPTSYQNPGLNSSNPSPVCGTNKATPGTVDNIRESPLI
ncbi:unnamed protein product [Porites evermanni]|uniref:Uncharacterized protein n=1 Tax=Porites evermanni TaxID=104178 RepID=A0ABN8MM98_9CNID|nr:unnamed protein product [Porites evermanni]